MNYLLVKVKNGDEYQFLPSQFYFLSISGIWCPNDSSKRLKILLLLWFTTILFLNISMIIGMIFFTVKSIGTDKFSLQNVFIINVTATAVYKSIKIRQKCKKLRSLIVSNLNSIYTVARDSRENEFHERSNLLMKRITIVYYLLLFGIFVVKNLLAVVAETVTLPINVWYPYSLEKKSVFWISYLHQTLIGVWAPMVHITTDTIFLGLLLHTTSQIDMLHYRLRNISNCRKESIECAGKTRNLERKLIIECIRNHQYICRYGKDLNNKFQDMIILLVILSLPNICITVYNLSINDLSLDYMSVTFTLGITLLQLLMPCWFGDEVKEHSMNIRTTVYKMDWTNFHISNQKLLIIIMARSLKPIRLSASKFFPINLQTFIKTLRAVYATFNLLHQAKHYIRFFK